MPFEIVFTKELKEDSKYLHVNYCLRKYSLVLRQRPKVVRQNPPRTRDPLPSPPSPERHLFYAFLQFRSHRSLLSLEGAGGSNSGLGQRLLFSSFLQS